MTHNNKTISLTGEICFTYNSRNTVIHCEGGMGSMDHGVVFRYHDTMQTNQRFEMTTGSGSDTVIAMAHKLARLLRRRGNHIDLMLHRWFRLSALVETTLCVYLVER